MVGYDNVRGAFLTVVDLTRRFRRDVETVVALDGVSLQLFPGELTVLAGPSGSGKTTLLSVMAGFERADGGVVRTHHPLPPDLPVDRLGWQHVAVVPQSPALLDELTVRENIEVPALLRPRAAPPEAETSADRIMDELQIAHLADRYPTHTSGGEQQRAAIGRALRLRPMVLLADEPTGHQDRARVDLVLGVLRQQAYSGRAVLVSSHDQAVIGGADRVVELADGRIVADRRQRVSTYGASPLS